MMSGPPVNKFTKGWALPTFAWGRAHFYVRADMGSCASLCGRSAALAGRLLLSGSWTRCKACELAVAKAAAKDLREGEA